MTKRNEGMSKTPVADMLTMREAALYLNITERTLISWRQAGKIAYYQIGRPVFFKQSDLDAFIESHRVEASHEA